MNILAFAFGALLHVVTKVLGYIGARKDQTLSTYCRDYWPLVAYGAIGDVLVYSAWAAGLFPWLASLANVSLPPAPEIPEKAVLGLYLFGGFFSDSVSKTLVASLERLLGALARRFSGENAK